ncbi:uncharacterized protein LOC144625635 [Crassostrea virginica]
MTTKRLRQQIKELERELEGRNEEENVRSRISYITPVRNVPTFSGNEDNDRISVDDWIEEIQNVMKSRHMNKEETIDFIYSHLTGLAKEEIKYRSNKERRDPTKVLRILSEAFGEKQGITVIQRNFFDRKQREGESLREYSYALLSLLKKITVKNADIIPNPDLTLCEQFAQNVNDNSLRRELKRLIRQHPEMNFLDFRDEAILYSEDEEKSNSTRIPEKYTVRETKPEATHKPDRGELDKLLEVIKRQEHNIDNLTKLLEQQSVSQSKQQNKPFSRPQFRRRCYFCNSENHLQRDCPQNFNYTKNQNSGK